MFDIVALGESLIDFTPSGENSQGMALFARNPGGAPANVLAMAAKLGGKTAFIGKVGDDAFGAFLKKTMEDAGVDVRGLRMTREYPTTLAFVQLTPEGDRSFTFYRKPGADVMLAPAEVDRALLRDCRIFHFGSVSLTDEPCRTATLEAAREAKAAGAMISYDPNYRPFLWDSAERAREALLAALPLADIVKVSEEEMELLTGEVQLAAGADALASRGAALVLVTLGPRGAYYRAAAGRGLLPACEVDTVDTTGAGDAFLGALLSCLAGKTLEELRTAASIDPQYLEILLKMLGISYLSEFAASLCRDGGYGSAAGQIELFGKLSILVVSMPVVRALLETMGGLLS